MTKPGSPVLGLGLGIKGQTLYEFQEEQFSVVLVSVLPSSLHQGKIPTPTRPLKHTPSHHRRTVG